MAAPSGRRNRREWNTLVTMVDMYCQHHHGHGSCCNDCNDLIDYARRKLFYLKRPEQLERYLTGLELAGVPAG